MKNILGAVGITLSNAVEYVVDKNRKAAQISRLKSVIRSEERISEKAFAALGKYYYHHLRDENDPVTEPYCTTIDHSAQRMDRAITRLEELSMEAGKRVKEEGLDNNLLSLIAQEPMFMTNEEELAATMDPSRYVGCAPEQVTRFLKDVIGPVLEENKELLGVKAEINV